MSGPVTRLIVALQEWVHTGDAARLRSALSGENVTSAQIEAMDAAAEAIGADPPAEPLLHEGGVHADWVVFHARDPSCRTGWRNVVCLAPKEADELLRVLLERAVQRRRRGGA